MHREKKARERKDESKKIHSCHLRFCFELMVLIHLGLQGGGEEANKTQSLMG